MYKSIAVGKAMARRIFIFFLSILFSCFAAISAAGQYRKQITLEQAKALVMAANHGRLPGITIEAHGKYPKNISSSAIPDNQRYLTFSLTWDAPGIMSSNAGFNEVDLRTGDVFDGVLVSCDALKNRKLVALQKQVRRSIHLTDIEYRKIRTGGPMCVE
jgi:hypothetical protein